MLALASGDARSLNQDANPVAGQSTLADDSAGQFACSLTHRPLQDCDLPLCDGQFCHVTLVLSSPGDEKQETLHVPWTVMYAGKTVDCTEDNVAPFDKNVACMKNVVHYGGADLTEGSSTQKAGGPVCDDPAEMRTFEKSWLSPPKRPGYDQISGDCLDNTKVWDLDSVADKERTKGIKAEFSNDPDKIPEVKKLQGTSTFTVIENGYDAASGYIYEDPGTSVKTGVLQLRSFENEEFALHSIISEFAAANIDAIMVDVRGNVGGSSCHVFDLIYLLSSSFNTPEEVRSEAAFHVRESDLMGMMVFSSSENLNGGRKSATNLLSNTCASVGKIDMPLMRNKFVCAGEGDVAEAFSCGTSSACTGPDAWMQKCDPCMTYVNGMRSEWSHPFQRTCARARGETLIAFSPKSSCSSGGAGGSSEANSLQEGLLRTRKAWPGCSECFGVGSKCIRNALCGFGRGSFTVLSDSRCMGSCALFTSILQVCFLLCCAGHV